MWTCVVVFALLTGGAHSLGDAEHHSCEENQVMSGIESSLGPDGNERQWKIECKALETKGCSWSGFQDMHEQGLHFKCPANQVVAGFFSEFVMEQGVRRWKVYCCSAPGLITTDCQKTPMVNDWNEDFSWHVPADNFLTGIYAKTNKADNDDQRWSFRYCRGTTDSESITSKIFAINKAIQKYLVQGDIVVNKNRNAMTCDSCKWQKKKNVVKVPYTLAKQFSRSEKRSIKQAIKTFKTSTCIHFIRRKKQRDYIKIVKSSGCWSYVGRTGGSQQLSLGDGCVYNGIIQHELSHALGFWHEQSRTDRDSYVRINYENIIEQFRDNFDKEDTNNLNVPYDYGSVMHYGAKDFSKNGEDTITPLTPSAVIGQRDGMSENDILKINKLYGCSKCRNL
ncbi:hatching enzyme 1.2-like [Chaetodon trifascialis]|uniref:hatching enzyme 1.2-like n=1 Tax=Chaetodon trifascialis TaxID=109706 RepID=UPI003992797C